MTSRGNRKVDVLKNVHTSVLFLTTKTYSDHQHIPTILKSNDLLVINLICCSLLHFYIFSRCQKLTLDSRYTSYQFLLSMGIEPMTLVLLVPCSHN